jgi:hypothetical protein
MHGVPPRLALDEMPDQTAEARGFRVYPVANKDQRQESARTGNLRKGKTTVSIEEVLPTTEGSNSHAQTVRPPEHALSQPSAPSTRSTQRGALACHSRCLLQPLYPITRRP